MLGLFNDFMPRFVKRFANLGPLVSEAAAAYAEEVRTGRFPAKEHTFQPRR
jgi:3-methyl-2-oxobutanoate hydroxymethyltransferase